MARAYNASTVAPQTRPVWGLSELAAPFSSSALVEYDYVDVPDSPYANVPRSDGKDVHECPRRESSGQEQIRKFVQLGIVSQECRNASGSIERCVRAHCPSGNSKN